MKISDLLKQVSYQMRFQARKWLDQKPENGFSIIVVTYNRSQFLNHTLTALVDTCKAPFEILVWDNCSTDNTNEICKAFAQSNRTIRYIRHTSNIGTSAVALAALEAKYQYLVEVDDDILAIQKNWQRDVIDAFVKVPKLAYLSLNVIQDKYTNGAKPDPSAYQGECYDGVNVECGPVGGWFAVTTREHYNRLNGFKFKPGDIFFPEDGDYSRKIRRKKLIARILKNTYVYHASGPIWNYAFGYRDTWNEKYESRPEFRVLIDDLAVDELPTIETAVTALRQATSLNS